MALKKMVDGVISEMTPEEEAAHLASLVPPPPTQDDLVAYAKEVRKNIEQGGILFAGIPIATDDRSKLFIMGARLKVMADPQAVEHWAAEDGNTYPLDATAIIALSDAVAAHTSVCFSCFAGVRDAILAGATTSTAQIDEAFAPIA